jgi:hypothetical protein
MGETAFRKLQPNLPITQLHTDCGSVETSGWIGKRSTFISLVSSPANAHREDEVAGVIPHERGHILSHQFAIETTAGLRRLLGVTSVTDRADIYTKFQRLADARLRDKHGTDVDSDDKQDEPDRVAVYATAAAGYRPRPMPSSGIVPPSSAARPAAASAILPHHYSLAKTPSRLRGIIAELPSGCDAGRQQRLNSLRSLAHPGRRGPSRGHSRLFECAIIAADRKLEGEE